MPLLLTRLLRSVGPWPLALGPPPLIFAFSQSGGNKITCTSPTKSYKEVASNDEQARCKGLGLYGSAVLVDKGFKSASNVLMHTHALPRHDPPPSSKLKAHQTLPEPAEPGSRPVVSRPAAKSTSLVPPATAELGHCHFSQMSIKVKLLSLRLCPLLRFRQSQPCLQLVEAHFCARRGHREQCLAKGRLRFRTAPQPNDS